MLKKIRNALHELFLVGITIKGIDGVLELVTGITLFFTKSSLIVKVLQAIFHHELLHDPTDLVANYLIHTAQSLSINTLTFISIYLTIHGIIKIGIFLGLWYKKIWAYPIAAIVLSLFVIYQSVRIYRNHSIILSFLTLIDIMILVLIRFEYKRITSLKTSSA